MIFGQGRWRGGFTYSRGVPEGASGNDKSGPEFDPDQSGADARARCSHLDPFLRCRYEHSRYVLSGVGASGQLEFIAYELLNSFQAVGMFLKRAKTVEEAREAVQPYVRRLVLQ